MRKLDGVIHMTALIFDTETHKLHGDIIEAAGVEVYFYSPTEFIPTQREFSKRYKPSEPISLGAMAVHHIVDEDLIKCPSFTKFKIPDEYKVEYLIGHNIDYDIAAINRAFLNGVCRHELVDAAIHVPHVFLNGVCRHEQL